MSDPEPDEAAISAEIETGLAQLETYGATLHPNQLATHPEFNTYAICDNGGIPRFLDGSTWNDQRWKPTDQYVIDAATRTQIADILAPEHPELAMKLGWRPTSTTDPTELPADLIDMFLSAYEAGVYDSDDPAMKHVRRLAERLGDGAPPDSNADV